MDETKTFIMRRDPDITITDAEQIARTIRQVKGWRILIDPEPHTPTTQTDLWDDVAPQLTLLKEHD